MVDRIINFGPYWRIRVDDSANIAYLEMYDTSISAWKVVAKADTTTIYDAGGIQLSAHASRHAYGGADALPSGAIDRTQIRPLGVHFVKIAFPTPGTRGAYGTAITIVPAANKSIVLLAASLSWGGTFASGETVTIRITVTFSDGTTASITKSATTTGTVWLTTSDLAALMKNGAYVTSVSIDSSSSATSTFVTTSVTIYAIEI